MIPRMLLVIKNVTLLSRNFCHKSLRENYRNFLTVRFMVICAMYCIVSNTLVSCNFCKKWLVLNLRRKFKMFVEKENIHLTVQILEFWNSKVLNTIASNLKVAKLLKNCIPYNNLSMNKKVFFCFWVTFWICTKMTKVTADLSHTEKEFGV